jgi:hypothetical protein
MNQDFAHRFAGIALGHVTREYPNKLDHVLAGPLDVRGPRELHPVFYGSLDWHSCVHGYWMLANLYRRFPGMPRAGAIRTLFDTHLVPELVAGECAYLDRPMSRGFERPYGWAWLLKLAAELALHETSEGRAWSAALRPLAEAFAARFMAFLPLATYPVRAGVHSNTAFSVRLALNYPDKALQALLTDTVRRWYGGDAGCQAWEPGGDEFLSPALIEAECMRAALPDGEFRAWFAGESVHAGDRQRPERREDRASGWAEPEPGVVLAGAGGIHNRSGGDTADGAGTHRCQPAACRRRLHG